MKDTISKLIKEIEQKNGLIVKLKIFSQKDGFVQVYYRNCSTQTTQKEAYYKTCDDYEKVVGREQKYWKNFDAFRKALSYKHKKKR